MDMLNFYRRTKAAADAIGSLMQVSRQQTYGRIDDETSRTAINLLVSDAENEKILFADLDRVVEYVSELRAEILSRRAAAVTKG